MAGKDKGFKEPSWAAYMNYLSGQQAAYNPLINFYTDALRGLPSNDFIRGIFGKKQASYLSGLDKFDTSVGGQKVQNLIAGAGAGLGIEGAAETGAAANTATGNDVIGALLKSGARSDFTQGLMGALQSNQQQRLQVGQSLAEARSKKRASAPDPLQSAMAWLNWKSALRNFNGGGGGGGTVTVTKPTEDPTLGLDPIAVIQYIRATGKTPSQGWGDTGFAGIMSSIRDSLSTRPLPNGTTESVKVPTAWTNYINTYGIGPH